MYDLSGDDRREELVNSLMETFSTGQRRAVTVCCAAARRQYKRSHTLSLPCPLLQGTNVSASVGGTGPGGSTLSAAGDSAYKEMCAFANEVSLCPKLLPPLPRPATHTHTCTLGHAFTAGEA